jgi:hypothetical protein
MPYIVAIEHLVGQECNVPISSQRGGVADGLFESQQHQEDIDSILHRLQEGQAPGKLL